MDHGVDTEEDEDQFKVGPHHTQWRYSRLTVYRQGMCCAQLRTQLWRLTEDPDSSRAAKVGSCTVLLCTALYCTVLCQGAGHRELPLPGDLHHHAHPLHRAGVPGLS